MSERDDLLEGVINVEFDDIVEFFRQRGTLPCPCCGHTKWDISDVFDGESHKVSWGLIAINLNVGSSTHVGLPTIHAECRKCAFMRMHDARAIAHWKQSGKPPFKDE